MTRSEEKSAPGDEFENAVSNADGFCSVLKEPVFDSLAVDAPSRRIAAKLDFLCEAEKLKDILRRNYILTGKRRENDAEHSWHVALMAVLFFEDAADVGLDLLRVLKMLLVHDLVEIDAGDTYAFDTAAHTDKNKREERAADRIFGLLPPDLGSELRALWTEFDVAETRDARFALALDRIQPAIQNYLFHGTVWKQNGVSVDRVRQRFDPIRGTIPGLERFAEMMLDDAVERGFFPEKPDGEITAG